MYDDNNGNDDGQSYHNNKNIQHTYDKKFWDAYADTNESRYDAEFAGRIIHTINEMRCASVLEVGCGTGIDLEDISHNKTHVFGLDPNRKALLRASYSMPEGLFARGMITSMPFADASIDIIFTHKLLNYLDDYTIRGAMREMYRVAKKYIVSCEWFSEQEYAMNDRCKTRNMSVRWAQTGAHIMADISIYDKQTHQNNKDASSDNYVKSDMQESMAVETSLTLVSK